MAKTKQNVSIQVAEPYAIEKVVLESLSLEIRDVIETLEHISKIEVTDVGSAQEAKEWEKTIHGLARDLESKRTEAKKPILAEGKRIDAYAAEWTEKLNGYKIQLQASLRNYDNQQRALVEEANRLARIERERLDKIERERIAEHERIERERREAAAFLDEPAPEPMPAPAPREMVEADLGIQEHKSFQATRKIARFRLIDITLVPREYLMLNESTVKQAQQLGRIIPGIEYYQEEIAISGR